MRIGIYGGAFDPPHVGHIRAAAYAAESLQLGKMLLIPTCVSPHKTASSKSASGQHRLKMLEIAAEQYPRLCPNDVELKRGGQSYSYETVQQIKEENPDAELVLFMGTDMFLSFLNWRNPHIILENASIGVFYRGQKQEIEAIAQQKQVMEARGAKVYLIENPVTEISSTQLRRMLRFGCAREYLPQGVEEYIYAQGLYGTVDSCKGLSMEALEQEVCSLLDPKRTPHVLGCRDTAYELAKIWGADEQDAARAALLHDVTKALDGPLQLTLCRSYDILLNTFYEKNPKILHAFTGSLVAERIFGENKAVVSAIASHTTGKPGMNTLEKIIYVADYMEPNRDFPGVEKLRELAYSDLDGALELGLTMTVELLQKQGREVSDESLQTLQWLKERKK